MKIHSTERGVIKHILFFTVAVCIIFLVVVVFAKYFVPGVLVGGLNGSSTGAGFFNPPSTNYNPGPNPLITFNDFGGSSGVFGGSNNNRNVPNTDGSGGSSYSGKISLSTGSAGSTYQTFEEYVILNNYGPDVNITGWTLTNSKGSKPIQNTGNNYLYPVADSATIGTGTQFLNPTGVYQTGPIILKTGDTAYLTTGKPFSQYPFPISTNFRENICVGYLKNYPFYPPLNNYCPYPTDDPLIRTVTDECYDYLSSLSRCEDPQRDDKQRFENNITSQCQQFIRPRFTYNGCVDSSKNLSNFSTNTWRIFLGKDRELWSNNRDTITLYDAKGLIVAQVSY